MRNLERELATLARKGVKELILSKKKSIKVTPKIIEDFLGVPRYPLRRGRSWRTWSAWSPVWPGPRSAASC